MGREERKPFGRFGIESSHRWTFAGLREADANVRNGPHPQVRIRATQGMNTHTNTNINTGKERTATWKLFILF